MKIIAMCATLLCAVPAAAGAQTIDPQHQALASLAGTWTVKQSLWLGDAQSPKIDTGTADFAVVLKRQLRQSLHIADGTDFEGLGYIGYDNGSAQYFTTWMDVNFPGIVVAYGAYDDASKTYVFRGTMAASTPGEAGIPVREVMTVTDARHFRYDYYETRGGKESLTVRLDYTRSE